MRLFDGNGVLKVAKPRDRDQEATFDDSLNLFSSCRGSSLEQDLEIEVIMNGGRPLQDQVTVEIPVPDEMTAAGCTDDTGQQRIPHVMALTPQNDGEQYYELVPSGFCPDEKRVFASVPPGFFQNNRVRISLSMMPGQPNSDCERFREIHKAPSRDVEPLNRTFSEALITGLELSEERESTTSSYRLSRRLGANDDFLTSETEKACGIIAENAVSVLGRKENDPLTVTNSIWPRNINSSSVNNRYYEEFSIQHIPDAWLIKVDPYYGANDPSRRVRAASASRTVSVRQVRDTIDSWQRSIAPKQNNSNDVETSIDTGVDDGQSRLQRRWSSIYQACQDAAQEARSNVLKATDVSSVFLFSELTGLLQPYCRVQPEPKLACPVHLVRSDGSVVPEEQCSLRSPHLLRFNPEANGSKPHVGVDYSAPVDTPVFAPVDGLVTQVYRSGQSGGGGLMVLLKGRAPDGSTTAFALMHLSKVCLSKDGSRFIDDCEKGGISVSDWQGTNPKRSPYDNLLKNEQAIRVERGQLLALSGKDDGCTDDCASSIMKPHLHLRYVIGASAITDEGKMRSVDPDPCLSNYNASPEKFPSVATWRGAPAVVDRQTPEYFLSILSTFRSEATKKKDPSTTSRLLLQCIDERNNEACDEFRTKSRNLICKAYKDAKSDGMKKEVARLLPTHCSTE